MKIGIVGAGGFGREIAAQLRDGGLRCPVEFFVDDAFLSPTSRVLADFDTSQYLALVAIGDPALRAATVDRMPSGTRYLTYIHPDAKVLGQDVTIGDGSIICAGAIVTTNIRIGKHAHLNLGSSIGHDCVIGDYFTAAPGVRVSGNCSLGDRVYIGSNAVVREKLRVCSDTVIGMMAAVTKHIEAPGVYVGAPARLRTAS